MKLAIEILGWYGVIAIMTAYALVSFSLLPSDGLPYQLLNATGALGIVAVSLRKRDYQPALLNIAWTVIALIAIGQILF